ncbi:MAG TPA: isoprenylcysteine carboxylmethyltransferase family protein [Longimicrobiales bacterium]|nr:isoprenylcysteine carboxylmethyltransferase family protein [Longimicrobiales bacterium]
MTELSKRALGGAGQFVVALALLLFLPAWSLRYWQAWVYWGVLSAAVLVITLYFLKRAPDLIERRLAAGPAAERERSQKVIQGAATALFIALLVVPGIEWRSRGTRFPLWVILLGDALTALAFATIFRVFQENRHASSVVEVSSGQRVITTGPYAVVRHPMYAGAMLLFFGTPLALGSVWALAIAAALAATIVVRLLYEERFLRANLPGYDEYRRKVRYRLVPYVW